jgi:hypothetical protein
VKESGIVYLRADNEVRVPPGRVDVAILEMSIGALAFGERRTRKGTLRTPVLVIVEMEKYTMRTKTSDTYAELFGDP